MALGAVAIRDGMLILGGLAVLLNRESLPATNFLGKIASLLGMSGVMIAYLAHAVGALDELALRARTTMLLGTATVVGITSLVSYFSGLHPWHEKAAPEPQRPPLADPYTHDGVIAMLDEHPLNGPLIEIYLNLMAAHELVLDLRDPLDAVRLTIKEVECIRTTALAEAPREIEAEYLTNLRMLCDQILEMRE